MSNISWKISTNKELVDEVVGGIAEDVEQVVNGRMWPLTCLGVFRGVNMPGWKDHSMEEIRLAAYSTKITGGFADYVDYFVDLQKEAKDNRDVFRPPGRRANEIVIKLLEDQVFQQPDTTPTMASFFSSFDAASPFGSSEKSQVSSINPAASNEPWDGIFAMAARGFIQASVSSQNSNVDSLTMEVEVDETSPSLDAATPSSFDQVAQPLTSSLILGGEGAVPSVIGSADYTSTDRLTVELQERLKNMTFSVDR